MKEQKQCGFRTTIGGQALIEGILMRGPETDAIVVRSPEGLVTKVEERKFIKDKYPILGVPIIRGAATFLSSKGVTSQPQQAKVSVMALSRPVCAHTDPICLERMSDLFTLLPSQSIPGICS